MIKRLWWHIEEHESTIFYVSLYVFNVMFVAGLIGGIFFDIKYLWLTLPVWLGFCHTIKGAVS